MVVNESTIPDLLMGPVNIKWEEGAPALVLTVGHTAVLYNGVIYVGGGACNDTDDEYVQNKHLSSRYKQVG